MLTLIAAALLFGQSTQFDSAPDHFIGMANFSEAGNLGICHALHIESSSTYDMGPVLKKIPQSIQTGNVYKISMGYAAGMIDTKSMYDNTTAKQAATTIYKNIRCDEMFSMIKRGYHVSK